MHAMSKLLQVLLWSVFLAMPAVAQTAEEALDPVPETAPAVPAAIEAPAVETPATVPQFAPPSMPTPQPEASAESAPDPSTEATRSAANDADPDPAANIAPLTDAMPDSDGTSIEILSSGERAELQSYVRGVVNSLRREHSLAALTLAVVKDDSLWMAQGFGQSGLTGSRPVIADQSLFRIGSVSKTFIWTAVMMLVERGQLDLDADVNSYLKSVRIAEAFGVPVTMRQLMHHRAGFEDSMRLFAVADDDPRSLAELLSEHQPKRVYAPGLRTSYSNWGAALAAQVVEDVSGKPYGEFLQGEILDPLGMQATTWTAPGKLNAIQRQALATGYQRDSGGLEVQGYMQLGAYWPAGGIASTATDMARWMRFHLNGGELEGARLVKAETHAAMWTRGYDDRVAAADVAHGFQDRPYHGLRLLGHGGGTAAFLTQMVLVPELKLGVFLSQNGTYTRAATTELPQLIIDLVNGGGDYKPALTADASDAGALAEVAGTYLQNRRVFSSFAAVMALDAGASVSVRSADVLLLQAGDESTQYRRVGQERDVFESADADHIAFVREGGRVVALADGSGVHTLEKVGVLGAPNTLFMAAGVSLLLALTSLLGFWWRLGRGAAHGQGMAAGFAATVNLLSALCMLGFAVAVALMVADLADFDLATIAGKYPSQSMWHTHYAGWAVGGAGAAMLLALIPAWLATGWSWWRRLNFTAFALALALSGYLLWQWRVFDAPVY
jgi:CubicO group peptidase (beta-lactamase class C family)